MLKKIRSLWWYKTSFLVECHLKLSLKEKKKKGQHSLSIYPSLIQPQIGQAQSIDTDLHMS